MTTPETKFTFSTKELRMYAREAKIDEWVFAFLDGPGINKNMANGLKLGN
jgi:hypothetical protein